MAFTHYVTTIDDTSLRKTCYGLQKSIKMANSTIKKRRIYPFNPKMHGALVYLELIYTRVQANEVNCQTKSKLYEPVRYVVYRACVLK